VLAQYQLGSVDLLDAVHDCHPNEVPLDYGTVCYAVEHVLNVALCFLLDRRAPGAQALCVLDAGLLCRD
jgi:hypothetical protein